MAAPAPGPTDRGTADLSGDFSSDRGAADFGAEGGLFRALRRAAQPEWLGYVWHPFVQHLAAGTLPAASYRCYLVQDYLFLVQFARAMALAAFKAESPAAMREKAETVSVLVQEMQLHLRSCAAWGLDEAALLKTPEHPATTAYTRWVLDQGFAGDILDLEVALAPCTVGYAEVARRILAAPDYKPAGNPYAEWIATYADPGYQAVAEAAAARIDALGRSHGGMARLGALTQGFATAARLEAAFWQMGLDAAGGGTI